MELQHHQQLAAIMVAMHIDALEQLTPVPVAHTLSCK